MFHKHGIKDSDFTYVYEVEWWKQKQGVNDKACRMLVDRIAQAFHHASHKKYLAAHWADEGMAGGAWRLLRGAADR
jgi:hypothetical protein